MTHPVGGLADSLYSRIVRASGAGYLELFLPRSLGGSTQNGHMTISRLIPLYRDSRHSSLEASTNNISSLNSSLPCKSRCGFSGAFFPDKQSVDATFRDEAILHPSISTRATQALNLCSTHKYGSALSDQLCFGSDSSPTCV